mgnify:CR=1 FL=1
MSKSKTEWTKYGPVVEYVVFISSSRSDKTLESPENAMATSILATVNQ